MFHRLDKAFRRLLARMSSPSDNTGGQDSQSAAELRKTFGFIDKCCVEQGALVIKGWALAPESVRQITLWLGSDCLTIAYGSPRPDVAAAFPGYSSGNNCGFEQRLELPQMPEGLQEAVLHLEDGLGQVTEFARVLLVGKRPRWAWEHYLRSQANPETAAFHFLIATSSLAQGGAQGLIESYRTLESDTLKVGVRVPILYMRTTRGAEHDFCFEPEFDTSVHHNGRAIVDDSLHSVAGYCVKHQLPLLLTLNGGIWADSSGSAPEWDLTDFLELEPLNCQWNQHDEAMPDDCLKGLSGSLESPELGRCLTFNCYALTNRRYKKRNLQQAASFVCDFFRAHPNLLVGINIDPDLYLNPFFDGEQWYDYNPGTIRQFRNWLAGSGPYAGYCPDADINLSHYPSPRLTLAEVRDISAQPEADWSSLEPPRQAPICSGGDEQPWLTLWEQFRRHLVHVHYSEMAEWLIEAGIPGKKIFTSQGLMAPASFALPFATRIDSPLKNYDSGGMSIEGAKPAKGHLGAIVYGASAINDIRMEGESSLFATLRCADPDWAVVEHNTADLRDAEKLPDLARAYQSLQSIFNFGARFISPMAWNGSNGIFVGQPGFTAYTAFRNTPLEYAVKHFMYQRANLPRGARAWFFGSTDHASTDGWREMSGAIESPTPGALRLRCAQGDLRLLSPPELGLDAKQGYRLLLITQNPGAIRSLTALSVDGQSTHELPMDEPKIEADHYTAIIAALPSMKVIDQLQIDIVLGSSELTLSAIVILPVHD